MKLATSPLKGKPRRMRVDREERLAFVRRLLTRPSEFRAVNFYHPTTLLKLFMDSLLTHKHFYVNLMIGKRVIRLRLAARQ